MNYRLPCAIVAAWLMPFCAAFAQSDTASMRHREHGEVTVTAQKARALNSSRRISYADIKPLAVSTLADALKLVNSVNIKDYGGIGGLRTVSVRGLGASHTLINYDGIQISNTQAGQVDISRFNFSEGQLIDLRIARAGYLSTAREYASPATLSISMSAPEFRKGRREALSLVMRAGSFGYFGTDAVYSHKISDTQSLKLGVGFTAANGEYPFTLRNYKTVTRERRINSDVLSCRGELDYYADFIGSQLKIKAYAYQSHRGLPGSVVLYNRAANERLRDRNAFFQGSFRKNICDFLIAKIYAKANYSNSLYEDSNVKYSDGKLTENSTQKELYASEVLRASFPKIVNSITFSLDETHSTLESNIRNCPQPHRNMLQSAVDVWRKFGDCLSMNLIGVYTRVREHVAAGSHFRNLDKWRPTVRLAYLPDGEWIPSVSLAYKNTFRVPTFNELYYTSLGTTGLVPEQAQEFQLDLGWQFLSVSAYRNYVKDKIVAIPTTYVWKMANYGKVKITGFDFSADKHLPLAAININLNAKYTYQKALNLNDKNPELYGGQVPYTPVHSGSYSVSADCRIITLGYSAVWSGKRYSAEYNIADNEVDAYIEHSISASRDFRIRNSEFSAKISCINLADRQYDVIRYYPMPGRQWQLTLSFKH